jgi:hypothetical protein
LIDCMLARDFIPEDNTLDQDLRIFGEINHGE